MCPDNLTFVKDTISKYGNLIKNNENYYVEDYDLYGIHKKNIEIFDDKLDLYLYYDHETQGDEVKIIHNIERMLPEMIDGIRSWIPLYMTGNITPYYSLKERGERFAHTLFLAPGKESITACHAKGNEANGLYNYCTVPSSLAYYEKSFEVLINNSEPLAKIITENSNNPSIKLIEEESLPNISIAIGPKSVYIKKMNTPEVSIVFFHPLIRNAFRSFFDDY